MIWPNDNAGIVLLILSREGGFINLPNDKGGPTSMGITIDTLASFRKVPVTVQDLQNLTVQEASALYLQKYIIGPNFDQLQDIDLRTAMADFGVLFGPIQAVQSLQGILSLPTDGILGPKTLVSANSSAIRNTINKLSGARIDLHAVRVTKDPSQLMFLRGWLSRALMFVE